MTEEARWVLPATFADYETTTGEQAEPAHHTDGALRVQAVYGSQNAAAEFSSLVVVAHSGMSTGELLLEREPESELQTIGDAECTDALFRTVVCAVPYRDGAMSMSVSADDRQKSEVAALVTQLRDELPG